MNENGHFPPPWNLDGEGFLLPFWADKKTAWKTALFQIPKRILTEED